MAGGATLLGWSFWPFGAPGDDLQSVFCFVTHTMGLVWVLPWPCQCVQPSANPIVGRINTRQDLTVSQGAQMLIKREFTWKSGAAREVARAEAPVPLAIELRD
jgi:hypothetical protein